MTDSASGVLNLSRETHFDFSIDNEDHCEDVADETPDDDIDDGRELTPEEAQILRQQLSERDVLPVGHRYRDSARTTTGLIVKPGTCAELSDGNFFKVKYIIEGLNRLVSLKGVLLKRNRDIYARVSKHTGLMLHAILPVPKNDLCMILKTTPGTLGTSLDNRCLTTIKLDDIVSERHISFTNHEHPRFSYLETGITAKQHGAEYVEQFGRLCCRSKFVEEVDVAAEKFTGVQLINLEKDECDESKGISGSVLKRVYGRKTISRPPAKTKACTEASTLNSTFIDLTLSPEKSLSRKRESTEVEAEEVEHQDYTYKRRKTGILRESIVPTLRPGSGSAVRAGRVETRKYTLGDGCVGGGGVTSTFPRPPNPLYEILITAPQELA